MDFFTILFWTGFIILLVSNIQLLYLMPRHALIGVMATLFMFVGSKLGRKFLGIE